MTAAIHNQGKSIGSLKIPKSGAVFVARDTHLLHMLSIFQEKKCSMCIVVDSTKKKQAEEKRKQSAEPSIKIPDWQVYASRQDFVHDQSKNQEEILGIVHIKDVFERIIQAEMSDGQIHAPVTEQQRGPRELKGIKRYDRQEEADEEQEQTLGVRR